MASINVASSAAGVLSLQVYVSQHTPVIGECAPNGVLRQAQLCV